ncbi:ABC transporter ATP-binding protein [Desulfatirhabdium butyrativorans]|uniref:ABC transporter ATP-binding protein n=1 Tax=Desulfatirhabdium butyrativorans TaxID=340467 RepID=UPI0004134402|nr:ABC transporter ATP-binding protein [Desulfatirhabdium butyrativorans]
MIDIEHMRLMIEGKEVLRDIDLHLRPGDTYGLLGPNGAGKSTTIFAMLGLRPNAGGHISVLGGDPAQQALAIRRSVGVMPEKAGFYEWMSALEYLKWYAQFYDVVPSSSGVLDMLENVGLGAEAQVPIGTYSRGMKQRLAVARALMTHPRLLILDEPTNGLDPKGRREIHDLVVAFASAGDVGVLLCTHLLDDVDRLCNRIGIIENGRTRLEGSLSELLAEQGGGKRYRLRLQSEPDTTTLPDGLAIAGRENGWWHVRVHTAPPGGMSNLWSELWRAGWKILEIRSEESSLEELYMSHTGKDNPHTLEAA